MEFVEDAGNMVYVLCDDAPFHVSAKDFKGEKGNTVYI